jgi:DNA-binding NtrC family response regulator
MSEYSLLIVDDDEEFLDTFSTCLLGRGFRTTTAHHPRLALAAAAYNTFDAAIIDMTLPEMNGLELIDKLKEICEFPMIVLTGNDSPKILDAATSRGVYRLLVKPVSVRVIEEVVRESLQDTTNSTKGACL